MPRFPLMQCPQPRWAGVDWVFIPESPSAGARFVWTMLTDCNAPSTKPPGVTVREELLLSLGPTPVKPVQLAFYLRGYNKSISDYLIQGFVHGFSIRYLGPLIAMRSQNRKSAKDNPTSVTEKLFKELTTGRIVGPFDVPPFDPFRVSPLGIIPKKSPGEFRLIHHL